MFKTRNTEIEIKKLFINKHTLERFKNRKTKEVNFQLPKKLQIALMPQRAKKYKNPLKKVSMHKLRAVFQIKSGLFIVGNIYEKDGNLYFKTLTVLNEKQLRTSNNFAKGNYLKRGFLADRPKIVVENKYFDKTYEDFLDKIEWEETDCNYL